MNFQDMIFALKSFWSSQGCIIYEPYDVEKGAGTMNPATFLRTLGPEPWHVAYVEPSRRPADGRYGDNPNRLYQHHQFQVICKPSPDNIQELYLKSLETLGINPAEHDIRFVEDNWESPTLAPGAWAGKSGSTAWKSRSSPTSSRSAASTSLPFRRKSHTAWNAWPCISRRRKTSMTSNGMKTSLMATSSIRTKSNSRP